MSVMFQPYLRLYRVWGAVDGLGMLNPRADRLRVICTVADKEPAELQLPKIQNCLSRQRVQVMPIAGWQEAPGC